MSLSERIKNARKQAGLTQLELADLIGVANSTVAGYEKGVREPDALKLKLIAKHTGVTGDYLLELEVDSNATYSAEALALAEVYDRLDNHSKRVVDTVAKLESERIPTSLPKGIAPISAMPMRNVPYLGAAKCDGTVETRHAAKQELAEMGNVPSDDISHVPVD